MDENYKKILPEEVFVTIFDRQATEEELWQGTPQRIEGYRSTGNDFINLYARLLHKYRFRDISFYAGRMGIDKRDFGITIQALTGITAAEWRNRYLMPAVFELLEKTDKSIGQIASEMGFSQASAFSKFFRSQTKKQPYEWRSDKRGLGSRTYHYDD